MLTLVDVKNVTPLTVFRDNIRELCHSIDCSSTPKCSPTHRSKCQLYV